MRISVICCMRTVSSDKDCAVGWRLCCWFEIMLDGAYISRSRRMKLLNLLGLRFSPDRGRDRGLFKSWMEISPYAFESASSKSKCERFPSAGLVTMSIISRGVGSIRFSSSTKESS